MIYKRKPSDFHPKFEVVSCFCEYQGKILLLQTHSSKLQGETWGVPAGKVNEGESLEQAMLRELEEETGYKGASDALRYGTKVYIKWPEYHYVYHMFAMKLIGRFEVRLNPREHDAFVWTSVDNALKKNLMLDEEPCIRLFYGLK